MTQETQARIEGTIRRIPPLPRVLPEDPGDLVGTLAVNANTGTVVIRSEGEWVDVNPQFTADYDGDTPNPPPPGFIEADGRELGIDFPDLHNQIMQLSPHSRLSPVSIPSFRTENDGFPAYSDGGTMPEVQDYEVELPSEFPAPQTIGDMLREAVRDCVRRNTLRGIHERTEDVLGDMKTAFDDPLLYKDIGLDGSTSLIDGPIPIQQFIGRILHSADILAKYISDEHCPSRSPDTYVTRQGTSVVVNHKISDLTLVSRYARRYNIPIMISGDETEILWQITSENAMEQVAFMAENLASLLTIYYRLNTRLSACHSLNAFPTFRNS